MNYRLEYIRHMDTSDFIRGFADALDNDSARRLVEQNVSHMNYRMTKHKMRRRFILSCGLYECTVEMKVSREHPVIFARGTFTEVLDQLHEEFQREEWAGCNVDIYKTWPSNP